MGSRIHNFHNLSFCKSILNALVPSSIQALYETFILFFQVACFLCIQITPCYFVRPGVNPMYYSLPPRCSVSVMKEELYRHLRVSIWKNGWITEHQGKDLMEDEMTSLRRCSLRIQGQPLGQWGTWGNRNAFKMPPIQVGCDLW